MNEMAMNKGKRLTFEVKDKKICSYDKFVSLDVITFALVMLVFYMAVAYDEIYYFSL